MSFCLRAGCWLVVAALVSLTPGCGSSGPAYKESTILKGKVTKGGQPLVVNKEKNGSYARVEATFYPEGGGQHHAVEVKSDGTFDMKTTEDKPLPLGKYRVAVRQWEPMPTNDLLKGQFDKDRTPIVIEITAATKEVSIDLDKPNG